MNGDNGVNYSKQGEMFANAVIVIHPQATWRSRLPLLALVYRLYGLTVILRMKLTRMFRVCEFLYLFLRQAV